MRIVYLDNNATTRVAPEVVEQMRPFFSDQYGNPSSMHTFGGNVRAAIEMAREKAASFIGASPDEIVFTSCGTESNNTALRPLIEDKSVSRLITTSVEHPAVLNVGKCLAEKGHEVTFLPVDIPGRLDLPRYEKALAKKPDLVSIMWANNETGVVFDIPKLSKMAHESGALFHTDAVQAAGKLAIDVSKTEIDMLSISGHKLHAPKGVGILYVRKGTPKRPFLLGGHQENGWRAGTENVPYIVGLGAACELAEKNLLREYALVKRLRDRLENTLKVSVPDVVVNGEGAERLPNTLNISFKFIEGESILYMLDMEGICASSGSACSSGSLDPSHVLKAMGLSFEAIHGSIRFSFSIYNTDADVDHVLEKLPPIVRRLREISPFFKPSASTKDEAGTCRMENSGDGK
jgi:cysteine desulfurase